MDQCEVGIMEMDAKNKRHKIRRYDEGSPRIGLSFW